MSAWKAPPSIVQLMVILLRAHFYRHQLVTLRSSDGFASGEQVWPRATDGVLEDVGEEGG